MYESTRIYNREAAFKYKKDNQWISVSDDELVEKSFKLAKFLYELGYRKGDRIGILSENRIEWIISDFACSFLGLITVPVFPILTPEQLKYIYNNCEAKGIFVSNQFQLNKIKSIFEDLYYLKDVFIFDKPKDKTDLIFDFHEAIAQNSFDEDFIKQQIQNVDPEDLLTIIYTSGTTGNPKGVMLTNSNILEDRNAAVRTGYFHGYKRSLSYLPLCHAYERLAGYYTLFSLGVEIALAESIESIPANIKEIKPNAITTVPKLMETIMKRVFAMMEKESSRVRKIFYWAIDTGKKYIHAQQSGRVSPALKLRYKFADKLVYKKIRERMGGELQIMVAGGAALSNDVNEFFTLIGITTIQGYGLTETSPAVSFTRPDEDEIGTVGKPFDNVEIKIADDGEILIKGPIVMKGYWKEPEVSAEVIKDGWFHTGDIGEITKKGNLRITDRKKNIFVSSGGKNIAPQPVENVLSNSVFVEQIVMFGDGEEFCSALIFPEYERLKHLALDNGIEFNDKKELCDNPKIIQLIQKDLNEHQKDFSKFEQVRKIALIKDALTVDNDELTPKLSFRRHVIKENHKHLLDSIYGRN